MNPALQQLKDIHLPERISSWPWALGWYVLLALILLCMSWVSFWIYKRHLHARAKKKALSLLDTYVHEYEKNQDAQWMSAQLSELLKRVALVYFPREEVASIHGEEWVFFLTKSKYKALLTVIASTRPVASTPNMVIGI